MPALCPILCKRIKSGNNKVIAQIFELFYFPQPSFIHTSTSRETDQVTKEMKICGDLPTQLSQTFGRIQCSATYQFSGSWPHQEATLYLLKKGSGLLKSKAKCGQIKYDSYKYTLLCLNKVKNKYFIFFLHFLIFTCLELKDR